MYGGEIISKVSVGIVANLVTIEVDGPVARMRSVISISGVPG